MPATASSAGWPSRSPTRWGRTCMIPAPARSSRRTSSSGTMSSSSPRCGTSCSARRRMPAARKLPLPDELTGQLLRYICCHEVGHTLGLRHNHRASQAYSISQLRDPTFCTRVRQRRLDHVLRPVQLRLPAGRQRQVHDPRRSARTTSSPSSGATGPSRPRRPPRMRRRRSTSGRPSSSRTHSSASAARTAPAPSIRPCSPRTSAATAWPATACGLKNLDRVMDHLIPATTEKGENFDLLEEVYGEILSHRNRWFNGVAKEVGGVLEYRTLGGRGGETLRSRQQGQTEGGGAVPPGERLHHADEASEPGDRQPVQVPGCGVHDH